MDNKTGFYKQKYIPDDTIYFVYQRDDGKFYVREPLPNKMFEHEISQHFFDGVNKLLPAQVKMELDEINNRKRGLDIQSKIIQEGLLIQLDEYRRLNQTTLNAIREAESGNCTEFNTVEELLNNLNDKKQ